MADKDQSSNDAIRVICRFRPMNSKEKAREDDYIPRFIKGNDQAVKFQEKTFNFDKIFNSETTQEQFYEGAAKPIVADILQGYNGTIFAYGQTSAGKTHTMEGVMHDPDLRGVIPRIVSDIFEYIRQLDSNLLFHIQLSYFEVYCDKIRDLLDKTKSNLSVHEDVNRVPYVKGATERYVYCEEEVLAVLDEGKTLRKVASTKMNADSSRSHSIFLINVKQEDTSTETKLTGKLYLVDLAGSEKVGKTGAEGETLEEAKNINKSLSALGNVISALAEGVKSHIPYRDSKMTRILQNSLGGNCRTTMIICCSPSSYNEAETRSTLLFGTRAKTIKNAVTANVELTADQWRKKFEKEEAKAKKYEKLFRIAEEELMKWRAGETVAKEDQIDFSSSSSALASYTEKNPEAALAASGSPMPGQTGTHTKMALSPEPSNLDKSKVPPPRPNKENFVFDKIDNEQVDLLYKQMDEKDDQINELSTLVERLKEQMLELEELVASLKVDQDTSTNEITRLSEENDISKAEVNEVLKALEELAVNYDQKVNLLETSDAKLEDLANDLSGRQQALTRLQSELATVTDFSDGYKRRASEMLTGLVKDIADMGLVSPSQIAANVLNENIIRENGESEEAAVVMNEGGDGFSKIDDEFTAARLLVSKVKSEVQTLQERCEKLDGTTSTAQKELESKAAELKETKVKLHHHENRVTTLSTCMKDVENKRRVLEDQVVDLQQEISRLRGQEQARLSEANSISNNDQQNSADLSAALEAQKQQYKVQSELIRQEIDEKQVKIDKLEEIHSNLEAQIASLNTENESLVATKERIEKKLTSMQSLNEKRGQARSDLRGLEETVTRELSSLHSLRKTFVKELTERARKMANSDGKQGSELENFGGSQVQKQRIIFLENNLDQLTKVHKSLVRDNSDLRSELPKLEKKLRVTAERVKSLEQALRDAKEGATRDRKRYQQEVDRIKETVRNRYIARKAQIGAQIARPIRAGHAPGINNASMVGIRGGGARVQGIQGGMGGYA